MTLAVAAKSRIECWTDTRNVEVPLYSSFLHVLQYLINLIKPVVTSLGERYQLGCKF